MLVGVLDASNWSGRPDNSWATSITAMPWSFVDAAPHRSISPPLRRPLSARSKRLCRRLQHDEEPPISAVDGYHAVEIAERAMSPASAKEPVEIEADDDDEAPEDWDECCKRQYWQSNLKG